MIDLKDLWVRQKAFNDRLKIYKPASKEYWAKQYLLGIASEIGEVLREIVWKDHRKQTHVMDRHNLGSELADLFKYTLCLFQLYDFSLEEMLQVISDKTDEVEQRRKNEFSLPADNGQLIVISDMDGTLCDWRKSFVQFLTSHIQDPYFAPVDEYRSLSIETELGISYDLYLAAKNKFEMEGGYLSLLPFVTSLKTLQDLFLQGAAIYVYTARPQSKFSRIWMDSLKWLDAYGLGDVIRELRIGADERISFACEMAEKGHPVVMLEDDPSLALRAANAGIIVFLKAYPYNNIATGHNILRVDEYNSGQILKEIQK